MTSSTASLCTSWGGGSEHQRILEDVAKIRNKKPITTKHVVVVDKFNIKI